jgi:beta-phosphoglucomutase
LPAAGWRQALASSAPRPNIDAILGTLAIEHCFDAIVSGEDVRHGKPDPQVFLLAAAKTGVQPRHCVVVEDSPAGVDAARRAGMRSIGVGSAHRSLAATRSVTSLADLPPDAFERLLEP